MTILSMYNSKTKMMIIYVMTVVNSIAEYIFLLFIRVFKQFEFQPYHEDYGDKEINKATTMIHNISSYILMVE